MTKKMSNRNHAKWSRNANIYEVNMRQYTHEGTFEAFKKELPRLRDMGIKILWLMPIMPISELDRQGSLGSYYAIADYCAINPEFGTMDDFKVLMQEAHKLGFKVILDFVANHTGNDHKWIAEHPEYYVYQDDGSILHPHGWHDVAQLNFKERGVWDALIESMAFWVKECDIDGFRCDMAHLVPLSLWVEARERLEKIKPDQFWLAECEEPDYHEVFDATYTWKWMHASEKFYRREIGFDTMLKALFSSDVEFGADDFKAYFTSNHDENSWNGTEYEKFGDAALMLAVFSCTWKGIPLIYSGQELPNEKRLRFFDKDEIEWKGGDRLHSFYKTLLELKAENKALDSGDESATRLFDELQAKEIFAFLRKNGSDEVLVILNFSSLNQHFSLDGISGLYRNVFGGPHVKFPMNDDLYIQGWGYLVFEKIKE